MSQQTSYQFTEMFNSLYNTTQISDQINEYLRSNPDVVLEGVSLATNSDVTKSAAIAIFRRYA